MYAKPANTNDLGQLLDSYLAAVILLKGASRNKSAVVDRKDQGLKQLFVSRIERDVYEDLIGVAGHWLPRVGPPLSAQNYLSVESPFANPKCPSTLDHSRPPFFQAADRVDFLA